MDIITAALACRDAGRDPDGLFAARGVLVAQVEACGRLMESAE